MSISAERTSHVELLRSFVNTLDVDDGSDLLESEEGLTGWLADHGLLEAGKTASRSDLLLARRLRDGLRDALMEYDADRGRTELDDAARRLPLRLDFTTEPPRIVPSQGGVRGGLGAVLSAVALAIADGTWSRLKICRADDCQWAFFDVSKNRSRTWCAMGVCGNRNKTRAYRARQRTASSRGFREAGSGSGRAL